MSDSFWQGTTDGVTQTYAVPFPYLQQSDVEVQLNGVTLFITADFLWTGSSTIRLNKLPAAGNTIGIYRRTSPDTSLVNFQNGSNLTAADLNTSALQNFYRTQEIQDQLTTYIQAGVAKYSVDGSNPTVDVQALLDAAAAAALATDLAQTLLNAQNDIALNAESILTNTNQIATLQATLDSLTSSIPGGIGTYLTNESNARISGDQALANTIAIIGAVSGGGATFTLNTASVYVDGTTSMADKFSGLLSTINSNTAAISSEATTRASADSALSTLITGLQSTSSANTAAIATEATTRASADSSLSSLITALTSTVNGNTAAISTEATTRAAADSANASSISTLTTTVNGHTASISTQQTSINGLSAQYTVRLNANGNIAGFGLASGAGGTSSFTVVANNFAVVDNSTGTPVVPFSISGGVVTMQNVVIGTAVIQNLAVTSGKIAANAATEVYAVYVADLVASNTG